MKLTLRRPTRRQALRVLSVSLASLLLLASGGAVGFVVGRNAPPSSSPAAIFHDLANPRATASGGLDFGLFWQAWNAVDDNFYGKTDNAKSRLDGAIAGMVASLGDPYTVYLPPTENSLFQTDLDGSFGGIGAQLELRDGAMTVVAPLDGTPAAKAGLQAGDVITAVDGTKVSSLSFDDAVSRIRGKNGTTVTLTVERAGKDQPLTFSIVRDTITVKSVSSEKLGPDGSVAYVKINQFGSDTTGLLKSALETAKADGAKGIVVDLRDNPGGYLEGAAQDIGMFLPSAVTSDKAPLAKRTAVIERFKDGSQKEDPAGTDSVLPDLPLVILVNGGSASASEIFSGALRDYGRATLVGSKTFGKGSAQQLVPLANGGAVKVTIAKWFTPLGNGIDGTGLQPDTKVDLPDGTQPSDSDAQVSKAIQILTAK